jgi:lipopolysaccharide transport protein LptA
MWSGTGKVSKLAVFGMIIAGISVLYGAESESAKPKVKAVATVVTSDSLLFDYGRSTCIFEKNVVVDDPRVKMKCDKLYIFFNSTNSVDSIVASGAVRIWQDDKLGVCDKAVYTEKTGAIVMTGHAKLQRGNDLVQGKEIKIFVNSEKVICTPGKLVIFPGDIREVRRKQKR